MPTLAKGDKVLVTGATGYIAAWVVQALLDQGFAVRGTVRSNRKGQHLVDLFQSYGDRFEIFVVEDMAAVSGISFLVSVASGHLLR